ncbi:MAG: hypothetical protein ACREJ2_11345 [Planctomycetota bacterium]
MADEPSRAEADRHFWRQVAAVTEGDLQPPADGWRKISQQIDADLRARAEPLPPPPPSRRFPLPGAVVWIGGLFVIVVLYLVTAQTRPVPEVSIRRPISPPAAVEEPLPAGTRRMRIDWVHPPLVIAEKTSRVKIEFALLNTGTGPIVLSGAGSNARHYLLEVLRGRKQVLSFPLVAESVDRRGADGRIHAVSDLALDQTVDPEEELLVTTVAAIDSLFPDGRGEYTLRIHYFPPASSSLTSPPATLSEPVEIAVVK